MSDEARRALWSLLELAAVGATLWLLGDADGPVRPRLYLAGARVTQGLAHGFGRAGLWFEHHYRREMET